MLPRVAFEYGQTWCASTLCISHSRRVHSGSAVTASSRPRATSAASKRRRNAANHKTGGSGGSGTGTKAWNGSPAARARYLGMPENPAAVRSASPSMT
jgi:hypothetical protein